MNANVDLFVRVLAQIEKHPETWNQADYQVETDCGTAYCFAGWTALLNGCWRSGEESGDATIDGQKAHVGAVAGYLLGLLDSPDTDIYRKLGASEWFAGGLFSSWNTLDDLYRISADLCGLDVQVLKDKVAAEVADGQVQR